MKLSYYPGCTLKNHAKNFEDSTLCSLKQLGIGVEELPRWNCCGTVFSLTTDDLIHHIAPVRNLIRAKEQNADKLFTLCAMCYNTLKRSNQRVKDNSEDLEKINDFMYREEINYQGDVQVLHLLEILQNEIKFENIAKKINKSLGGLNVASYYGCMLVRPQDIGFDDMENPSSMDDLMSTLGAQPVEFPYKTECCGAYQTVDNQDIVAERTFQILSSAQSRGAEVVAVSCPLCAFNLDQRQKKTEQNYPEFKHIPVLYFTQLLALALGCPKKSLRLDLHHIDPKPILKEKGLI
ncbi:CoB--CoM heterodisulfide reductase iron-sulfur subunit B family protein [bacterium]|nr:CoB--CoM heterodisulfide reductase iron-sulfur subunit B family protein [bacterium]